MRRLAFLGVLLFCLGGCTVSRLDLPDDPFRMTIVQRRAKAIPGSRNTVKVHLDDITGGQVLLEIRGFGGKVIVDTTSVKAGDTVPFRLAEGDYYLHVLELRNLIVGNDFGVFEISTVPPS